MIKKIVLWIAVLGLSVQIFGFSGADADKSGHTSKRISTIVFKVVKEVVPIAPEAEEDAFFLCDKIIRKTAHFTEFMLLSICTLMLARSYRLKLKMSAFIAGTYGLLYAITDEIHQRFIPGRSGEVLDVCIDFAGVLTGVFIASGIILLYRKKREIVTK